MYPMLKPALRRAWRGRGTVQFGVTPAHAVKLSPMDIATGCFLELLDGTRGLPLLREEARALDLSDLQVDTLVGRLTDAGLIDDVRAVGPETDALRNRPGALERHRPDLASLSVVHPEPGGGMRRLAARRAMRVQVRGAWPGRCRDRGGAVRIRGGPGRGSGRRVHRAVGRLTRRASTGGRRGAQGHRRPAVGAKVGPEFGSPGIGDGGFLGGW